MKPMRLPILLCVILMLTVQAGAQSIWMDFPGRGPVLVYKVSSKEAARLYSQRYPSISEKILHTPVDTLTPEQASIAGTGAMSWEPGHYIACHVAGDHEVRELKTMSSIVVRPQMGAGQFRVQVSNEQGEPLPQAEASWHGKKLEHLGDGVFAAKTSRKRGLLRVRHQDDEYLGWWFEDRVRTAPVYLQSLGNAFEAFWAALWKPFKTERKGYVAFSQPVYRPGDTLRAKAYIVNQYGKPIRSKMYRKLYFHGIGRMELQDRVKPTHPGVFLFEMAIPDSFQLDATYILRFSRRPYQLRQVSGSVRYEDYLLRDSKFELAPGKSWYASEDTARVMVKTLDANGLGLPGAEIKLKLSIGTIDEFGPEAGYFPEVLWEEVVRTGPDGLAKVEVPRSSYQGLKGNLVLEGEMRSGSNEILRKQTGFYVDALRQGRPGIELRNGQVLSRDLSGRGLLLGWAGNDTLIRQSLELPMDLRVDTLVANYALVTPEGVFHCSLSNIDVLLVTAAVHRGDSVFFSVANRHRLPVRYSVWNGGQLVDEGTAGTENWEWVRPASPRDAYRIELHWHWAGKPQWTRRYAIAPKRVLKVELSHPERVLPGEQVQIGVKITDEKGRAVPAADLTSGAVTESFSESNFRHPPSFRERDQLSRSQEAFPYRELHRQVKTYSPLTRARGSMFALDSLDWYKMLYPPQGWYVRHLATLDGSTQFAPFWTIAGYHFGFNMIWVDGKLVSFWDEAMPQPYAFALAPGFHHLRLQNERHTYEVDNVWFPEGKKLEVFLDPEHPPRFVRVSGSRKVLHRDDHRELAAQLLWIYDSDSGRYGRVGQGDHQAILGSSREWRNAGVFRPGPVWILPHPGADTIWINFEPGNSYRLRDGFVFHDVGGEEHSPSRTLSTVPAHPGEFLPQEALFEKVQQWGDWPRWRWGSWEEAGNIGLYLSSRLKYTTAFLVLVRESDQQARIYQPDARYIRQLVPGKYRFWACDLNGKYQQGPLFEMGKEGSYFMQLEASQFEPGNRPVNLVREPGKGLDLAIPEKAFCSLDDGYLDLRVLDGLSGKPLPSVRIWAYDGHYMREVYHSDDSGRVALKFPGEGWYALDFDRENLSEERSITASYHWHPGSTRSMVLKLPFRADASDNMAGDAFSPRVSKRKKVAKRFSSGRLKRGEFTSAPPRAGTRSNYHLGPNDQDITYGMISRGREDYAGWLKEQHGGETLPVTFGQFQRLEANDSSRSEAASGYDQLRSAFADAAWWQPTLSTDENGEAYFQATFPDDLTRWMAWVVAMDRHRRSGFDRVSIQSYRDLVAKLTVPQFLLEQDEIQVRGEVVNRSGSAVQLTTSFEVNGQRSAAVSHQVDHQLAENHRLVASGDTMQVSYGLKKEDRYGDGELRPIPVYPRGILRKRGGFAYLDPAIRGSDTVFSILPDPNLGPVHLVAQFRPLDFFLDEIEKLENYPYTCMEQTASRLLALLSLRSISTARSERFHKNADIKAMIRRLENAQQGSGGWGWWYEARPDLFMTAYVCRALRAAQEQGYATDALARGKAFLQNNLPRETSAGNLVLLRMAADLGIALDYEARLGAYVVRKPSVYDRLQIARIRQLAGLPFDWEAVWKMRKLSLSGGWYWGDSGDDLLTNAVQATLIVYRMMETLPEQKANQAHLRRFFLEQGAHGLGRNTFEAASVLEAILPYYLSQPFRRAESQQLTYAQGGKQVQVAEFPANNTLGAAPIQVRKTGPGPVFLSWYQEQRETAPAAKSEFFAANTHFEQGGRATETLKTGERATLVTEVTAQQASSYVMVEIPLPAGCAVGDKSMGRTPARALGSEVHREYFRDRVCIFLSQLPEGKHVFEVDLEPRFAGRYTLNPVQVVPMYLPLMSGNNELRRVEIR